MRLQDAVRGYGQWNDEGAAPPEAPRRAFSEKAISDRIAKLRQRANNAAGSAPVETAFAARMATNLALEHDLGPNGELPPEPDASDRALVRLAGEIARQSGAYVRGNPVLADRVMFLGRSESVAWAQAAYSGCVQPMRDAVALHAVSVIGEGNVAERIESFVKGFAERLRGKCLEADGRPAPSARPRDPESDWAAGFLAADDVELRLSEDEEPEVTLIGYV